MALELLNFADLQTKILDLVEDAAQTLYTTPEIVRTINLVKDELTGFMRALGSRTPLQTYTFTPTSVASLIDLRAAPHNLDIAELLLVYSDRDADSTTLRRQIHNLRSGFDIDNLQEQYPSDITTTRVNSHFYIGFTDKIELPGEVTLWYVPFLNEITDSTTNYVIGPPPCRSYLCIKTASRLLFQHGRYDLGKYWADEAANILTIIGNVLDMQDRTHTSSIRETPCN